MPASTRMARFGVDDSAAIRWHVAACSSAPCSSCSMSSRITLCEAARAMGVVLDFGATAPRITSALHRCVTFAGTACASWRSAAASRPAHPCTSQAWRLSWFDQTAVVHGLGPRDVAPRIARAAARYRPVTSATSVTSTTPPTHPERRPARVSQRRARAHRARRALPQEGASAAQGS